MPCGSPANVSQVLIGLHRVGILGLREALAAADASGLREREAITDRILQHLEGQNYISPKQQDEFRVAVWREFLRLRQEDLRPYFSRVDVTVRGAPGERRRRFVEMLTDVLGDFELSPRIEYVAPDSDDDPSPELLIHDEAVIRGDVPRRKFKAAVQRRISDW